jgi:CelD/BcsL family acetyltransferase involved in cellulose biosynthesis
MSLHVSRYPALSALPETWRALVAQAEATVQYDQTLTWFQVFEATALEKGEIAEIVCVEDAERRPLVCLPMKRPSGNRRTSSSLSSYYTSLYSPLWVAPPKDAAAARDALRAAMAGCDVIRFEPLASDDSSTQALIAAFSSSGYVSQGYFKFGNWYLEVGGRSFADYFKALPSQLRNTVTRKEKKLRAEPNVTVEIVTDPARLGAGIEAYQEVYAASWKVPEPHPRFVPELLQAMAERGWLRLGVVKLGEEAIAAQIWIVKDGVASIFKLAYKEQHAKLSAGSILTTTLMRHVMDVDRVHTVDYLTGDDGYKRDWMSHRRERIGLVAANLRSVGGLLFAARHIFPTWIRRHLPQRAAAAAAK